MAKIFRTMKRDGEHPLVENSRLGLGAREGFDVFPDDAGQVRPNRGGMSVMSSRFPAIPSLVPKRLKSTDPRYAGGTASAESFIFSMGEGPFVDGGLTEDLALRTDPAQAWHGFVEPQRSVSCEEYGAALANTRESWKVDEGEHDR